MASDQKSFLSLFPVAEKRSEQILPVFQAELAKNLTHAWNDPPLDPTWTKPNAVLVSRIESAQGLLAERFAFCQTMPMDEFLTTAEALRKSGYRPIRFRPYADEQVVRVASIWTRDGRNWRISSGISANEVRQENERNERVKFIPVDVAGYMTSGKDGKPADRYAALWVEKASPLDHASLVLASSIGDLTKEVAQLKNAGLVPLTMHSWRQADDNLSHSGVWRKPATETNDSGSFQTDLSEANLNVEIAEEGSLIDLDVNAVPCLPRTKERATTALQAAEAALEANPENLNARFSRATAYLQVGENQKALDDLNIVIEKKVPVATAAYQYRAITHSRLGHKNWALLDLAHFEKGDSTQSSRLYLAVIVAAELGDDVTQAFEKLDTALQKQPDDAGLHYNAACAYSMASQKLVRKDPARGRDLAERATRLLQSAIQNGFSDYNNMQEDADLDPIRDLPAFNEIMKARHLDRSYAAVWSGQAAGDEAMTSIGLDPAAQLVRCRELASQGYRPVATAVARTSWDCPLVTASIWHRPVISEETKDQLAERQARAAVAVMRLGKSEAIFTLLRHSADPRLRSFIVNWLNPLGADPKLIVAELDQIDPNVKPTLAPGQPLMDAVLFNPETSQRRALILALGTYGVHGLSSGEREPLIAKLVDLYRNDPDAGIHGASEWTLRQWKQLDNLKQLDAELMKIREWGDRRWFMNGHGQTFAVIEGPVEFEMGSPPTEPGRNSTQEKPRRLVIPRRFAIAAKEVTVEQWLRFERTHTGLKLSRGFVNPISPYPDSPMIGFTWYIAADYCNWLSEQEGLPKDQWCYLPNESGAYAEGMTIPANVLHRTGYRLPTEAEWEYACRSGASTSRYFGQSIELLGRYAWYQSNSKDHAWPCGSLLPNDLGLFDMLGNEFEWVQDRIGQFVPEKGRPVSDSISTSEIIYDKNPRILRSGSFDYLPAFVRSAYRVWSTQASRGSGVGFRPSRTYP